MDDVPIPVVDGETLDWETLDRLRRTFLSEHPGRTVYWTSEADLAAYDATYGQRIAWKWDAVLRELRWRGWTPPAGPVLDWGCGSGLAGRRFLGFFGAAAASELRVFDQSATAEAFALRAARTALPGLPVVAGMGSGAGGTAVATLLVSHVLNELVEPEIEGLVALAATAQAVVWVEPGTHAVSRRLCEVREALRDRLRLVAPCTHQAACGILATGNERHWCHHFADPPSGIMADSAWVRFAQRAGIDLRRLPYSFVVLDRRGAGGDRAAEGVSVDGCSRVIAQPETFKGYVRLLSCQADGAREVELQKRDDPALYKALKAGGECLLYAWAWRGDRIGGARRPAAVTAPVGPLELPRPAAAMPTDLARAGAAEGNGETGPFPP